MKTKIYFTCRHCHEDFTVDKETLQNFFEGWIDTPDICDDCFDMIELSPNYQYDCFDADPGL